MDRFQERRYWSHHFPWSLLDEYLRGSDAYSLERRELAVQWGTTSSDTHMERNRSYADIDALKDAVCNGDVMRLESGCFFPGPTRKERRNLPGCAYPIECRFDVDITDYEGVTCASHSVRDGACDVCWVTRLEPGIRVLRYLFKELLGLQHVIWVWSGNKGFHALCMDRECLAWDDETRKAVLALVLDPGVQTYNHVCDTILWPLFEEQYCVGEAPQWYPVDMAWLATGTSFNLEGKTTAPEAFEFIQTLLGGDHDAWLYYRRQLMKTLYWPRVDRAPLECTHLLKIPFCVHEKTKKVSIPLHMDTRAFRPSTAPTRFDVLDGKYDLSDSVQYMRSVLQSARAAQLAPPPTLIPDVATKRCMIYVEWCDKTEEQYTAAMAAVAELFWDQYVTTVLVATQERYELMSSICGTKCTVVWGVGGAPAGSQVTIATYGTQCKRNNELAMIVFDDASTAPPNHVVVDTQEAIVTLVCRIRQALVYPHARYIEV